MLILRHLLLPFKLPFFDFLTSVSVDVDNLASLISKINQVNKFLRMRVRFPKRKSVINIYLLLSLKKKEDDVESGNKVTFHMSNNV